MINTKNVQHLEELLDNAPDGRSTGLKPRSSLGLVMDVPDDFTK
jgi:hypothetical protein